MRGGEFKMNKETLMKMDKNSLVDALVEVSESNIRLNQALTKIESCVENIFIGFTLINATNIKNKEEIKNMHSIFEEIKDNNKSLRDYFDSMK
jgi:hypothetical protein